MFGYGSIGQVGTGWEHYQGRMSIRVPSYRVSYQLDSGLLGASRSFYAFCYDTVLKSAVACQSDALNESVKNQLNI